ncbi:MAG: VOC family protein [Thermodesulfobacteriota bacterium]
MDHVEIVSSDTEKSIDFYVSILGFKIKSRNEVKIPPIREIIYFELGDTVLEIISADAPDPKSEAS